MRALVTGGAGFIGSHIARELCRRGVETVVLDDLSSGSLANLEWRGEGDKLEVIEGDIRDEAVVERAVRGCDWVFHEAALASVPASVAEPVRSNEINLEATLGLLERARQAGVRRLVFACSCAVYADGEPAVKKEGAGEGPASPYGLQKFAGEKYCGLYSALYCFGAVSLRYFNVFGPRQSFDSAYSGVIARFCTALLKGEQPVIFGDGGQSRDFVYVADVVQANLLAAEAPAERVAGKALNVGTGRAVSVLELYQILARIAGAEVRPRHEAARAGEIRKAQADISQARALLGYEPKFPLEEGLRRTLEFYREHLVAGAAA